MDSDTHHTCLRRLWWLHPGWLFAAVVGGTMGAAYAQTDAAYALLDTPKYINLDHVALAAAAILAFALGQQVAETTGRVPAKTPVGVNRVVRVWFWLTTCLALFGYLAWLASGVSNGFSLATMSDLLTVDEPGFADQIKTEMFATIKGVTTWTQCALAAVPLGLWLLFVHGERVVVWPIGSLGLLATVRAFVLSERLALIELVVMGAVPLLRFCVLGCRVNPLTRLGLQLAPLLGVAALLLTFGTFEYFRSWRHYQHEYDSLASFTVMRVTAYYTTAHNNGAMAIETQRPYPLPYSTIYRLWSIPGLDRTAFGYEKLTGVNPKQQYEQMLERHGNPEFNNEGGLFQPALDFGWPGYLAFWFGAGFVAGRLYRHYLVGTLIGSALFPLMVLAILETPRLLYLANIRCIPALVALLATLWLAHRRPRAMSAPASDLATA
jgi:hypothetical protein